MNVLRLLLRSNTRNLTRRLFSSDVYEPTYLDALKPSVPLYDTLNVQIRGYDFAILESYQALIHSLAKNMELDVEEGWAVPPQQMQVTTYKPNSEIVNTQYNLNIYQRTVQLNDVFSTQLPLLIRALEASAPAGVSLSITKHEDYHDEERYIPDKDLLTLKQELEDMGGTKKK